MHQLRAVRQQHRVRTEIQARIAQRMAAATEVALDSPKGQALLDAAQSAEISPTTATSAVVEMLRDLKSE